MSLVAVENLTARHGLMTALSGVSFALAPGEVLAVIGANGAGKTTLMRCIAGTHVPAEGRILLRGADVTALPAHARVRAGIAMAPEGRRLFADMSVRENLIVAGENGCDGDWRIDRVVSALPQLADLIGLPAGGLSGGQRQAAAIGRALMANPALLLLDEVSLGLSPAAVEGVYASLDALRAAGEMAILLVEQDLKRALSFADRVICMAEGRIELEGRPGALDPADITRAYFGIHEAGHA